MNNRTINILIVEDQPIVRAGLRISLQRFPHLKVVGESCDGETAILESRSLRPDVVLLDMRLPGIDGAETAWQIKHDCPHTRVLMFTSCDGVAEITGALGAGADGYCLKDSSLEQIENAVSSVARGEVWIDPLLAETVLVGLQKTDQIGGPKFQALSDTETQILELISTGLENIGIAHNLEMDAAEVIAVMRNIIQRYSTKSPTMRVLSHSVDSGATSARSSSSSSFTPEWFAATLESPVGKLVADKYVIERLLGEGGIGTVYRARHLYMNRTVAVKFLQPQYHEDAQVLRAFQQEANALAKLTHRNIVNVYDFGVTASGQPYLEMEFIEGADLDKILQSSESRKLDYRRFLSVFRQVCEGLAAAHASCIIHCDLKPSNIFVLQADDAGDEKIKLVDFGLSKLAPRNATVQSQATDRFTVNGTPAYMPPEQCAGVNIDERTDIYALGSVMYEALCGINPFNARSAMETFAKQFEFIPPPVSCFCPDWEVPYELEQCIAKMLAKNPKNRYQSVQEVLTVLRQLQQRFKFKTAS